MFFLWIYWCRKKFLSYISDISNNNDDFNDITKNFLFDPKSEVTRDQLVVKLTKGDNKYYVQKAKFILRLKLYLIIIQYFYLFVLDIKNKCVDNLKDSNDKKFWYCEDEKCKVESIKFDWDKFLRIVYLFGFDLVYLVNQWHFLHDFQRRVLGNYNAQCYQLAEYLLIILIYSYDLFNDKICVESGIKNIFYKNKILSFDLILLFIDVLKFIIK